MNTGNFPEAELFLKEAYDLRRRVMGDDHPDVAITANNLGILKKDMGHLEEAAEYFEEALRLRRKVIKENHINTAISKFSYEELYLKIDKPKKAQTLQ